jgi:hypothetical protein
LRDIIKRGCSSRRSSFPEDPKEKAITAGSIKKDIGITTFILSSTRPSAPAKVCLIHGYLYRGFYKDIGICPNIGFRQAHKLFSVQKVLAVLLGKLPYKEVRQLVEEACSP